MELLFCNTHNPLDCQITSDYSAIKVITDVLTGEERRGESPVFWEVAGAVNKNRIHFSYSAGQAIFLFCFLFPPHFCSEK